LGSNRARSAHVSDVDEQIALLKELNAASQVSQPMLEIAAAPQPVQQPLLSAHTTAPRPTATNPTVMMPAKVTPGPTLAPRQAVKPEPTPFRTVSAVLPNTRQPGFAEMRSLAVQQAAGVQSSSNPRGGIVMAYSPQHRMGYVHFEDRNTHVTVGTQVYLRPDPLTGNKGFLGFWRVTATEPGCALIVPLNDDTNLADATATVGNHVSFGMPEISVAPAAYHRR
jgi:hypothetical protein